MQLAGGLTGPIAGRRSGEYVWPSLATSDTVAATLSAVEERYQPVAHRHPAPHATANDTKLTGNVAFRFRSYWKYAPFSCMELTVPTAG